MSMQVGVNFGGSLELLAAMGGVAPAGSDVGEGDPGHPPYTGAGHEPVAAFDFYWDEGGKVYRMRDPVVVSPDGEAVECENPGELEFGKKYYCVVGKKSAEGYEAKVVSEDEAGDIDEDDYSSWWKVPLFKVPYEQFEDNESDSEAGMQYHVGAVVIGGAASRRFPEPFDYSVTDLGGSGDSIQYHVSGGSFYFDGELRDALGGLDITGSGEEHVYIVCLGTTATGDGGSGGGDDVSYTWSFRLDSEEADSEEADLVINVKLYDFMDGEVTMDYRGVNLPVVSGSPASSVNDVGIYVPQYEESVDPDTGEVTKTLSSFANPYYEVAGILVEGPATPPSGYKGAVLALEVKDPLASEPDHELTVYGSVATLRAATMNLDKIVIPLYQFDSDGNIVCDFRHMPRADMWVDHQTGGGGAGA